MAIRWWIEKGFGEHRGRLSREVDYLKEKYEIILVTLLAIEKGGLNEEARVAIQLLKNDVADSASQIMNG